MVFYIHNHIGEPQIVSVGLLNQLLFSFIRYFLLYVQFVPIDIFHHGLSDMSYLFIYSFPTAKACIVAEDILDHAIYHTHYRLSLIDF